MMTLTELLAEHGAASWDKQQCLADLIGDNGWQLDIPSGQITFGARQTFPVQILGTESDGAGTWLWSWANVRSGLPESLLQSAESMKAYGAQHGVPEFTQPDLTLDESVNGHLLSTVACGLCGADAYYRGPYDGGAVFLLLSAPETRQFAENTPTRLIRIFNEFISAYACDHRAAFAAYARYKGCSVEAQGTDLAATLPEGAKVQAAFDTLGRLSKLSTTLRGAAI